MIPSKTVCKKSRKSFKNFKDRVSIMLCANMDATDRLNPLIIGKLKNPKCFKKFKQLDTVTCTNSKRASMTSFIYTNWLKKWNQKLITEKGKILLLVDNCPAHKCLEELSNI